MHADQDAVTSAKLWTVISQLATRARAAESEPALQFVMANGTFEVLRYRSALVFTVHEGEPRLACASGLTAVDRTSVFGSWSERVVKALLPKLGGPRPGRIDDVPPSLHAAWNDYWPATVQIHPVPGVGEKLLGVVVYVLDTPWPEWITPMLDVLHQAHGLCLQNLRARRHPLEFLARLVDGRHLRTRRYLLRAVIGVLVLLCLPIRQFVIAPAEIVSLDSVAVTSPVEGVVAELVARPNQTVRKGDILVRLDDTAIRNRLASARQSLEVARAEYLAGAHRAFVSADKTAEAGVLKGRISERLAEVAFLEDQLTLLDIRASHDGIAVYGQENDWIGKPVSAGQRIMELADSDRLGVYVWVPVADAINLRSGATLSVLLYAAPLNPLAATVEQASYQATRSPEGVAAYRVRATLQTQHGVRLGLRGSAKITGEWVMFGYFVLRRPLSVLRQWFGI